MEKLNQNTPYNTTQMKTINSISLEHTEPLVEHTLGKHSTLSSNKAEAISDPGSISTTSLFQKPIVFANNIEWAVSQASNTIIYTLSLLNIFEMLNISPGGQNLRGNTFFRSGAKIELKLTSSPFHSGKLVFYYTPPGVNTTFRESIYSKVQFPCVYVDAGNSTTGVLDIPYVAIKDFFSTVNPDNYSDFGTINVAVLNPLRIGTGGPTSVQLALTLHPTQNQIALPVLAHDIVLQGMDRFLENQYDDNRQIVNSENPFDFLAAPQQDVGHLLFNKLKDIVFSLATPDEQASKATVQAMLNKPIDTSIKEPDVPKKLPKPIVPNNTTTQNNVNNSAPTLSNLTGVGTEHLSLIPEQTIVLSPPNSEMNLKRVAQTPSLIRIGEWTDAQNSGSELFKVPIDPMIAPFLPTTGQTSGVYYPTFLSHVVEPFAFWRGSLDFHFSFASTDQHKGKVIAAWIPFDEIRDDQSIIIGGIPSIEQLSLFPNEIFDLSLNKEFSFSVPYNSETPFRKVNEYNTRINTTDGLISGETSTDYSLGTLLLYVYNKLSHPSTVSSTINYNVYVKAGEDFQFRALKFNDDAGNQFQKINYITLQSLDMVYESTREGMSNEKANRVGVSPNGLTKTSFQEDDSEEHLGTLLQKYYPQFGYNLTLPMANVSKVSIASNPGLSYRTTRNTDPTLNPDPRWRNLIAHFRDIYAFWEGSLNYFIIHNSTVNNPVILMASHDPSDFARNLTPVNNGQTAVRTNTYFIPLSVENVTISGDVDLSETSIYSHISNIRVNPTIEITTPHRSIYRRLYTTDFRLMNTQILDQDRSIGTVDIVYSNPSPTEQTISGLVYQSIGDDFQFKYLIPPPSLKSRR